MSNNPKDGVDLDGEAGKTNASGGSLFRSIRNRFSLNRSPLNHFDPTSAGPSKGVDSPDTHRGLGSNKLEKGKGTASAVEFSQSKAVFALDVSGSTAGKILQVEKDAITTLTDGLSTARKGDTQILPWSSHAHQIVRIDELDSVDSSGGTNPTALLRNMEFRTSLISSDVWFLLTDGEIDERLVGNFALDIGVARIHGTALVTFSFFKVKDVFVLFCQKASSGSILNILQHGRIYIKISYTELHNVQIPLPRKPDQDTVVLSSGQLLDLNKTYTNTLDERTTQVLLESYEDLDTLILTAHTRGRADDVRSWVSNQRIQMPINSPESSDRSGDSSKIEKLRESLRACHERNWELFSSVLSIDIKQKRERDWAVDSCGTISSTLGPVSTAFSRTLKARPTRGSETSTVKHSTPPLNLLFLKGYEGMRKWDASHGQHYYENCYGTCDLCGETDVILCLLLKNPPEDIETEGFPAVGSNSKHKFPLVLGNYPETDVIASLVCCDACSHFLVQYGETPTKERLVAALPLVSLWSYVNKKSWIQTLSQAFQHRFHDEVLILILLSSICNTIDDLNSHKSAETDATVSALKRALHHLSNGSDALAMSSLTSTSVVSTDLSTSLSQTLSRTLERLNTNDCPLLFYPLDGFVVLVQIGSLFEPDSVKIYIFVWLRILYHFTEKHYALRSASGDQDATHALRNILSGSSDLRTDEDGTNNNGVQERPRKCSISIAQLEGTCLLQVDTGELATLQRLGEYFQKVESSCAPALAVFLQVLLKNATKFASPEMFFHAMKSQESLQKVFWEPESMSEGNAREMITNF
ncbi:hypothetical protein F5884DRAFT_833476 [Xylogone sp. PMI_703]|nr:hypothetical protein F5884DRAFT_833476 [Xylogone sp. PMI_703]